MDFYLKNCSGSKMFVYTWKSGLSANNGEKVSVSEIYMCTKSKITIKF